MVLVLATGVYFVPVYWPVRIPCPAPPTQMYSVDQPITRRV